MAGWVEMGKKLKLPKRHITNANSIHTQISNPKRNFFFFEIELRTQFGWAVEVC